MQAVQIYQTIIDNMNDGVYYVDLDRRISLWNKKAAEITGYEGGEIIGLCCQETNLNHIDGEGRPLCELLCPLFATNLDGEIREADVYVQHKDGYRLPIHVKTIPVYEEGEIIGSIEVFNLAAKTRYNDQLVQKLSDISMHDSLTRLPNRRYLESLLEYRYSEFQRFRRPFAVLFADIDNFRSFNNTFGHYAGDAVLRDIAEVIHRNVRQEDLIGRWSGDEFVGIFMLEDGEDPAPRAERFRSAIEKHSFSFDGKPLNVTVSVGITKIRPDDTGDILVNRADGYMYRSKKAGKNCVTSD